MKLELVLKVHHVIKIGCNFGWKNDDRFDCICPAYSYACYEFVFEWAGPAQLAQRFDMVKRFQTHISSPKA